MVAMMAEASQSDASYGRKVAPICLILGIGRMPEKGQSA
jgi:hypothetical protein